MFRVIFLHYKRSIKYIPANQLPDDPSGTANANLQSRRAAIYGTVGRDRIQTPANRYNLDQGHRFDQTDDRDRSAEIWKVYRERNLEKRIYDKQRVSDQAATYVED